MKRSQKLFWTSLIFLSTLLICATAGAHDLWIEAQNYSPAAGQPLTMVLAYDHALPAAEYLPKENLDTFYVLDPAGQRVGVTPIDDKLYKSDQTFKEVGPCLVVASSKGRFWTKTTEGYKSGQSKKGLSQVISCTYSTKFAKAVVGMPTGQSATVTQAVGHDLEIVPKTNPAAARTDDFLAVSVLYKGKPLPGCQLMGTYKGFSPDKNTFAYATKTDAEGNARIKIVHSGIWLVTASNKEKYPDPVECDENSFSASLTFEIGTP